MVFFQILTLVSQILPVAICMFLLVPFLRFMAPAMVRARMGVVLKDHDGLFAALFLVMLNRVWFLSRPLVFGARLDAFKPGELPYLGATRAWSVVALLFLGIILLGYRKAK